MSYQSRLEHLGCTLLLCGLLMSAAVGADASSSLVLPFLGSTWNSLTKPISEHQQIVVFSTTDCAHCPKVINNLAAAIHQSRIPAQLHVVVMDGEGHEEELLADRHYRLAHHIYTFKGDPVALRFKVNPQWKGITPYIALISKQGHVDFHTGAPTSDVVRTFLSH